MTPQENLGAGLNSYNTLSNNMPPAPTQTVNENASSPADDLTNQFAEPFSMFSTLIENYPAAQNEGRQALQALYKWLDAAMNSLNSGTNQPTSTNTSGNSNLGY